jgi:riboflavin kinase/FMN adenylyltransferase
VESIRHIESHPRRFVAPVVTLGNFDGVHRGHQAILQRVVTEARARRADAVAITFHPHPVAVLRPDRAPSLLMPLREKVRGVAATGIDVLVLQHFTRAFAALEPETFVERFLVERLHVSELIVGHSVSFGHERRGNAALVETLGHRFGFGVEVVGPVRVDTHEVSSSLVRRTVTSGDLRLATSLLGRPHALVGRVVVGKRRGAALGFPTANVHVRSGLHPPDGVYAVRVEIDERRRSDGSSECAAIRRDGIANIGCNPTFGANARTLEAHLFDFDGDLYGRRCRVALIERVRGEITFTGVDALVAQIRRDADAARAILAREPGADAGVS